MRRLLTDVLDICLHETGDLRPRRVELLLEPLLRSIQGRLRRQADKNGQRIELQVPSEHLAAYADPDLLERILMNLVGNAINHGPRLSPIVLAARASEKDRIRLEVRDRGAIIPADSRAAIFRSLESRSSDNAVARGFGLGLTFCKLAVEVQGGTIGVSPSEDGGNCFHLELPSRATTSASSERTA